MQSHAVSVEWHSALQSKRIDSALTRYRAYAGRRQGISLAMDGGSSTSARPTRSRGESDGEEVGTDTTVHESTVLVQGRGGGDDVLRVLDDIADAVEESKRTDQQTISRTSGQKRKHEDRNEFQALIQRLTSGDAEVVLRKIFLYRGQCNVMQEIWIQDKKNPAAQVHARIIEECRECILAF